MSRAALVSIAPPDNRFFWGFEKAGKYKLVSSAHGTRSSGGNRAAAEGGVISKRMLLEGLEGLLPKPPPIKGLLVFHIYTGVAEAAQANIARPFP